jgi:hypothetical protein
MIVFAIIIFGLATVRTFTPLIKQDAYKTASGFIGTALVAATMLWCYVWFLTQHVNLK